MKTSTFIKFLAPCLLASALFGEHSVARVSSFDTATVPAWETPGAHRSTKDGVSLDEAVSMVRKRYGGRVINADTRKDNGRRVHVIKILSDGGRVRTVKVDAQSGNVL